MLSTYLEFERPLAEVDRKIAALGRPTSAEARRALARLKKERRRLEREIYGNLTAWQRVQLSRHTDRPQTADYIRLVFADFFPLCGDRTSAEDPAILGGVASYRNRTIVVVGHQRGHTTQEKLHHNFGMARPEGYRKAVRLFHLAARFGFPLVTFIDTQGAYPGVGAEERGQAEAIATSLRELSSLPVPVVCVVIGEGGSGGALALGVGDRILMQEYACYSVISPEGCASILYREGSPEAVERAAAALRLTAPDLLSFGLIDEVICEPAGGAHRDPTKAAELLDEALRRNLEGLLDVPIKDLLRTRYEKFRRLGARRQSPDG